MLPSNLTKLRLPVHKSSIISDKVNGTETAIIWSGEQAFFCCGSGHTWFRNCSGSGHTRLRIANFSKPRGISRSRSWTEKNALIDYSSATITKREGKAALASTKPTAGPRRHRRGRIQITSGIRCRDLDSESPVGSIQARSWPPWPGRTGPANNHYAMAGLGTSESTQLPAAAA